MPKPGVSKPKKPLTTAIGIDGCPAGWASLKLNVADGGLTAQIFPDAAALFAYLRAESCIALIDMPIGLADSGRRACEKMARAALGRRRSSVFSAPRRPMLAFETYEQANAWGKAQGADAGGGLSKQAWNITPKIKDIDVSIQPADQAWLGEGHPELAFARLIGAPCRHPKRTDAGVRERRKALKTTGVDWKEATTLFRETAPANTRLADDDILDACVLAMAAAARLRGEAMRLTDGARDVRGLLMEIWG